MKNIFGGYRYRTARRYRGGAKPGARKGPGTGPGRRWIVDGELNPNRPNHLLRTMERAAHREEHGRRMKNTKNALNAAKKRVKQIENMAAIPGFGFTANTVRKNGKGRTTAKKAVYNARKLRNAAKANRRASRSQVGYLIPKLVPGQGTPQSREEAKDMRKAWHDLTYKQRMEIMAHNGL